MTLKRKLGLGFDPRAMENIVDRIGSRTNSQLETMSTQITFFIPSLHRTEFAACSVTVYDGTAGELSLDL